MPLPCGSTGDSRPMKPAPSGRPLPLAFACSVAAHLLAALAADLFLEGRSGDSSRQEGPAETSVILELEPLPEIFVDASSALDDEPPESTPYYSSVNARAADASPEDGQERPRMDGSEEIMWKTLDTPPDAAVQASPAVGGPGLPEPETPPGSSPSPAREGDGAFQGRLVSAGLLEDDQGLRDGLPSSPAPSGAQPREPRERPRTLAEAHRQQNALVGRKRRQEGGVSPFRLEASPDLLATPFGEYDTAIIRAVQSRWYAILENNPAVRNARGKVILAFVMKEDGGIEGLKVVEDSVGFIQSLACQQAVSDPAPYKPWPEEMRRLFPALEREVRFSFFYN